MRHWLQHHHWLSDSAVFTARHGGRLNVSPVSPTERYFVKRSALLIDRLVNGLVE
jgi:hypothetical protein